MSSTIPPRKAKLCSTLMYGENICTYFERCSIYHPPSTEFELHHVPVPPYPKKLEFDMNISVSAICSDTSMRDESRERGKRFSTLLQGRRNIPDTTWRPDVARLSIAMHESWHRPAFRLSKTWINQTMLLT